MPVQIKWPFGWFKRKAAIAAPAEPVALPAPSPAAELPTPLASALAPAAPPAAPARPAPVPAERPFVYHPEPGEGPDLGAELLTRLPQLSTPPMLGQMGGLPAMAQTLPTVDRFMQQLPAAPVQRLLEGSWSAIEQFTSALPALSSLGGTLDASGAPSFPDQLASSSAGLTDVLPPLGSLPGQVSAISGEAPILSPEPRQLDSPVVPVVSEPSLAVAPPDMPVLRSVQPPAAPSTTTGSLVTPTIPGAPVVVQPLLSPAPRAPETPLGLAGMLQLVSVEHTLTGNVLPANALYPVLRELIPYTPISRQAEPAETPASPAAPASTGERVTPVQRAAIEGLRGQGQPLAPSVREQFEGAYGAPLAAVRVHTGQAAHETAQSLNAIAFASGPDLFFSRNTYQPHSEQGLGLLGHELAHVVQQQYGVAGDPDALRPADDHYERRADQMAATALDTPLATPSLTPGAAPVQRALLGQFPPAAAEAPSLWSERPALARADAAAPDQPLATGAAQIANDAEDMLVQRFSLGSLSSLARHLPSQAPSLPSNVPSELPSFDQAAERVSGLTDQLPNPGGMLSNANQIASSLPSLGGFGGLAQNLPSMSGGLPSLSNLPGRLTDQLPSLPSGLPSLGSGLPGFGGLSSALGGGLPSLPGLGDLPSGGALPSLDGLQLPAMPLAEGLGGAASAAGGALAGAGQEARGSITSMAPSLPDAPAAPPLPSLEKLTEHIWKQVQQRLKVERERARGLA